MLKPAWIPRFAIVALLVAGSVAIGVSLLKSLWSPSAPLVLSQQYYWSQARLGSAELEVFLSEDSCYSNTRTFLACVNSIQEMALNYDLLLDYDGVFRKFSMRDFSIVANEKSLLTSWEPYAPSLISHRQVNFTKLFSYLDRKYIQPQDRSLRISEGMNAFLSVYKDPHTYFIPIAMYKDNIVSDDSRSQSLGFSLRRLGARWIVQRVRSQSPADVAGLKKGDWLVAIEGQRAQSLSWSQLQKTMQDSEKKIVKLGVLRQGQYVRLNLIRDEVVYASVAASWSKENPTVGVISIRKFADETCSLTKKALEKLESERRLTSLMLDLRDNPGGLLREATCVSGLFLKSNSIVYSVSESTGSSSATDEVVRTEGQPLYDGQLSVLVNASTASAAELLAGALQDHRRAIIVGERTYGKGTFQEGHVWKKNEAVALFETQGFYYLPSGKTPQGVGVLPDVVVENKTGVPVERESDLYMYVLRDKQAPVLASKAEKKGMGL